MAVKSGMIGTGLHRSIGCLHAVGRIRPVSRTMLANQLQSCTLPPVRATGQVGRCYTRETEDSSLCDCKTAISQSRRAWLDSSIISLDKPLPVSIPCMHIQLSLHGALVSPVRPCSHGSDGLDCLVDPATCGRIWLGRSAFARRLATNRDHDRAISDTKQGARCSNQSDKGVGPST